MCIICRNSLRSSQASLPMHTIGAASRVDSVMNLHETSVYALLLYATISQEKPAGFKALFIYVPISKSTGYELAGSVHYTIASNTSGHHNESWPYMGQTSVQSLSQGDQRAYLLPACLGILLSSDGAVEILVQFFISFPPHCS